jgi:CheY-like chemotaxis protein
MSDRERYRVLCVDDSRDAAETTAVVLDVCGFQAKACSDGEAALAEFRRFAPHACVLDLLMPGMDGFELARRLRAAAGRKPLVLLTATGSADPDLAARATAAGFDATYLKPVDPQALVDLLNHLLDAAFRPAPVP